MFSCLNILILRIGGIVANISAINHSPIVTVRNINPSLSVSVSQVCSVGLDKSKREIFMVKEGVFLLADGKTFNVIRSDEIL